MRRRLISGHLSSYRSCHHFGSVAVQKLGDTFDLAAIQTWAATRPGSLLPARPCRSQTHLRLRTKRNQQRLPRAVVRPSVILLLIVLGEIVWAGLSAANLAPSVRIPPRRPSPLQHSISTNHSWSAREAQCSVRPRRGELSSFCVWGDFPPSIERPLVPNSAAAPWSRALVSIHSVAPGAATMSSHVMKRSSPDPRPGIVPCPRPSCRCPTRHPVRFAAVAVQRVFQGVAAALMCRSRPFQFRRGARGC